MWSKKDLVDKQAEFWVVLARGATLQAACDAVGVNRRTGRRWRQGTGGRIPRKRPEPSGRYLGLEERLQIADLRLAGVGVRAIGVALGVGDLQHALNPIWPEVSATAALRVKRTG